jgi:hypothetical protein
MPLLPYRAKETTNTTGTGTLVLNAAETNARSFNVAFGASFRRILYMIQFATGFEFGLGDFDGGSPGTLTRATVLASSNGNALVTLAGGTKDVFAVFDPAAREVISISATATLGLADLGNAVVFTGASASTLNLPAVATAPLGAGWTVINSGTAALTIDPSGAELLNGAATLVLPAGDSAMLMRAGTGWTAARMLTNVAPIPTASAGLGQVQTLYGAPGANLNLPAGGQWFYFYIQRVVSGLGVNNTSMAITSGGSLIATSNGSVDHFGYCWRIA